MRHALLVAAVFATITSISTPAHAVTFILREIPTAEFRTDSVGNSAGLAVPANPSCMFPSNASVAQVVRAAAVYWGTIYTEPHTITITWGFSTHTGSFSADSYGTHVQAN